MSLKKIFFNIWSGQKRVFMHLRLLPDHQKLFFKKDIFLHLEWLKTCFDAFAHTSRTPETPEFLFFKKDIFDRRSDKNVFGCIFAYFLDHQKFFFKDIFYRLEWLKTCFDAFAHTCRPPETLSKKIFLTAWSG